MTDWPSLPLEAWRDTYATLHRYAQIVGKILLAGTPLTNHHWNAALHLTARGLSTPPIPFPGGTFDLAFDFLDHTLVIRTSEGAVQTLSLRGALPVADFYGDLMALLGALGIRARISDRPVEILTEAIPFQRDRLHASYDPEPVERWFRIVSESAEVLQAFRARFVGKCSPVHFFWGSFDLAVSRFSGRRAPLGPDADAILREAYSHEVSSVGFWPGDVRFSEPAYYAYTVPAPKGLGVANVRPEEAFWHGDLSEFLLPYETVRYAANPRAMLLDFAQSTYEAGAELAAWDRAALERPARSREMPAVGPTPAAPEAP